MSSPPPLLVVCPCCSAVLKVDAGTGAVLSHEAVKSPGTKADLGEALKGLEQGKSRREDLFRQSMSEQKNKGDLLDKKFQEAVKRAKENPDAAPPPREVDL